MSDLFRGLQQPKREVKAVAFHSLGRGREWHSQCVLEVELAGLTAELYVGYMGERGTKADSSGKTVWREIL